MTNAEVRALRTQLLLLVGLFAGCLAAAGVIATQRPWFESFLGEKYAALPADLQPLADAAAAGAVPKEAFAQLTPARRLALYDDWLTRADAPLATPAALLAADPALYLARAERSLVCGRPEQRSRALEFLKAAGAPQALPILRKVQSWARHRGLTELTDALSQAIHELEHLPPRGTAPATLPTPLQPMTGAKP